MKSVHRHRKISEVGFLMSFPLIYYYAFLGFYNRNGLHHSGVWTSKATLLNQGSLNNVRKYSLGWKDIQEADAGLLWQVFLSNQLLEKRLFQGLTRISPQCFLLTSSHGCNCLTERLLWRLPVTPHGNIQESCIKHHYSKSLCVNNISNTNRNIEIQKCSQSARKNYN